MSTPGSQIAQLTGTTYVDVVAAPGASTQRKVAAVNCANTSTTAAATVTLAYDDNGTVRIVAPAESIPAGGWIQFGPFVLDTTTRKLKAKLAATGTVDVVATYAD